LGVGECVVQVCAVRGAAWPQHRVAETGETGVGLAPAGLGRAEPAEGRGQDRW